MAFQPVDYTCGVVVKNKLPGSQDFLVDLAFNRGAAEPSQLEMVALATTIDGWWSTQILPYLCATVSYVEVIVTQLALQYGFQVFSANSAGVGGVGTEQAPNAQAACISLRTGTRGRSFRGRNYLSGVPNADIDVNTLSPTFMSNIANGYNTLRPGEAYDPTPFTWCVVSRYFGGVLRTPKGVTTPIVNALFTDDIIDDQRRRKPGVGG